MPRHSGSEGEKIAEIRGQICMRQYVHGDIAEDDPKLAYCSKCDLFVPFEHFDEPHPSKLDSNYERYLRSKQSFAKAKRLGNTKGFSRPTSPPNLFA